MIALVAAYLQPVIMSRQFAKFCLTFIQSVHAVPFYSQKPYENIIGTYFQILEDKSYPQAQKIGAIHF